MMDLRNRSTVTALDPKGMWALTDAFAHQCREALRIALVHPLPRVSAANVVLTGLGGSASGGDFTKALFDAQSEMPFLVNRDYHLPRFVGPESVVFCSSYSGNTEETLSAYADAKRAGAKVVCVTSGGSLKALAEADRFPVIQVPGGQPPRTALGFMMVPVLVACVQMGLLPAQPFDAAFNTVERVSALWTVEGPDREPAQLAERLYGAVGILYGLGSWQGLVANRWKCQINENSKNHVFANTFPELNHNEILGWVEAHRQGVTRYVGAVIEDGTESAKMKTRLSVTERLVGEKCRFTHVRAIGDDLLTKMLTAITFGDYVSLYLAALNQVDPENIDAINTLKSELSRVA
jgi:glucose/mannose-6-phosphate isomerase